MSIYETAVMIAGQLGICLIHDDDQPVGEIRIADAVYINHADVEGDCASD